MSKRPQLEWSLPLKEGNCTGDIWKFAASFSFPWGNFLNPHTPYRQKTSALLAWGRWKVHRTRSVRMRTQHTELQRSEVPVSCVRQDSITRKWTVIKQRRILHPLQQLWLLSLQSPVFLPWVLCCVTKREAKRIPTWLNLKKWLPLPLTHGYPDASHETSLDIPYLALQGQKQLRELCHHFLFKSV